jgi:hypothetical protein
MIERIAIITYHQLFHHAIGFRTDTGSYFSRIARAVGGVAGSSLTSLAIGILGRFGRVHFPSEQ